MYIATLEARCFRNLRNVSCSFDERTVIFEGANGQGKTNLLEAMYVCATGKSFRNASPKELLTHNAPRGKLLAVFVRHGVRHHIEIEITPKKRTIHVDGRILRKTSSMLDLVNVVAFFPDDLRIIKGSPEERRRFLDRAVANEQPAFVEVASAYGKALKSRNALLRQDNVDMDLIKVYNTQLVEHGAIMQRQRCGVLDALMPYATKIFGDIMNMPDALSQTLTSGFEYPPNMGFEDAFLSALERGYSRDRARGLTSLGPHRTDVLFELHGQSARAFASQGQQRGIVLAMKLAEVALLSEQANDAPILLLDDVSSELDTQRNRALFSMLEGVGAQILVSTTGAAPLPLSQEATRWHVQDGTIKCDQ